MAAFDLESNSQLVDRKISSNSESWICPEMTWINVDFKISGKSILTKNWGTVKAGEIYAFLGPSGAGKSTLLNVLAGRPMRGHGVFLEGKVTVGGKVINPISFRKHIAYVMQDYALFPTLTPREAIMFSANMRLPAGTPKDTITAKVKGVIDDLNLTDCADILTGNELMKGISSGQKKRLSVGIELVTDPSIFFLDEPTSGLDSYTAYCLVILLKKVAARNCAVLCSIHQPSSEIFFLFDSAIFLKEGRIVYQGPVENVTTFLTLHGYECPLNYNPADYAITICQTESIETLTAKGMFINAPEGLVEDTTPEHLSSREIIFKAESSYVKQLTCLTYREFTNITRDVGQIANRLRITLVINLLLGLIFLSAGKGDNGVNEEFNAHFGAVMMIGVAGMMSCAQPVMLSFPYELQIFLREYSTGTYSVTPYFVSKLLVEMPMTLLQITIQFCIVYFLIGLQGHFLLLVLIITLLGLASSSVAVMMGCCAPNPKKVTEMAPLLFVPQLLFVGFFISVNRIPAFLRWAQYLCSLKYAMNLILLVEFNPYSDSCNSSTAARTMCEGVLSHNKIDTAQVHLYIIALLLLFVGFRSLAMIVVDQSAKNHY